jgi:hypothetical protein
MRTGWRLPCNWVRLRQTRCTSIYLPAYVHEGRTMYLSVSSYCSHSVRLVTKWLVFESQHSNQTQLLNKVVCFSLHLQGKHGRHSPLLSNNLKPVFEKTEQNVCKHFYKYYINILPPLWSSVQSFWLQIQRPGFGSRRYQIFWEVVGLERGPLSLVSKTEELLGRKSSGSGLEIEITVVGDPLR